MPRTANENGAPAPTLTASALTIAGVAALRRTDQQLLELDLIKVKGKKQAVRIYTLVGDIPMRSQGWFTALKQEHDAVLAAYRSQQWDEAEQRMDAARAIVRQQTGLVAEMLAYYDIIAERIAEFRVNSPGADWDGVYVAESK